MNGIYDFEKYRTPHLDMEMLMERKAKKREKQMLVLSCVVVVIMAAVSVMILATTALIDEGVFAVLMIAFALYVILGAACIGKIMKKREEELWQQLV